VAGSFVQVSLQLPDARMDIPTEALLVKGDKAFAVVVGGDSRIHLQPLQTGEDTGGRVRIQQGLNPGERIVLNPNPSFKDGDRVQVVEGRP